MQKNREDIAQLIICGNESVLSQRIESDEILKEVAQLLKKNEKQNIEALLKFIYEKNCNDTCDRNIGNILQYLSFTELINVLKAIPETKIAFLCDSIGLSWVLGETRSHDPFVSEFLYIVLDNTRKSNVWWRAAFSLNKITGENAVVTLKKSLKKHGINNDLNSCLSNLKDNKNVVNLLLHANSDKIQEDIYEKLKEQFLQTNDKQELKNILWLLGRLRLLNDDICSKISSVMNNASSDDKDVIHSIFSTLTYNQHKLFNDKLVEFINNNDPFIRKMAFRGLGQLESTEHIGLIEQCLEKENDDNVICEITEALYKLKNESMRFDKKLNAKYIVNENGLIYDNSDKWYAEPSIYNIFTENQDVENVCFNLILEKIKKENIIVINPIDLATGTGRAAKNILNKLPYKGMLYAVDSNREMCKYLKKTITRQKYYINNIEVIEKTIEDFKLPNNEKSTFIISYFGFPSSYKEIEKCKRELLAVYNLLDDKGVFITVGWDEKFNDELSEMWYNYVPDDIVADSFSNWQCQRSGKFLTPRNCQLTWYKQNLKVLLQYANLEESVNVMGHFFGKDAAVDILKLRKTDWWLSMGITYNTKQEIKQALSTLGVNL